MVAFLKLEHIAKGFRGSLGNCPLALCLNESFPEHAPWWVSNTRAERSDGGRIVLSIAAQDFIRDFDAGRQVYPGDIVIREEEPC